MKDPIEKLRKSIDSIDEKIIGLLDSRAKIAKSIGKEKEKLRKDQNERRPVYDPEREKKVLTRLESKSTTYFPKSAIRPVYREIISACRAIQNPLKVAYLGPEGTYSHMAAHEIFGFGADFVSAPNFGAVFELAERHEADFAVVAIENSTEGGVVATLDLLLNTPLKISGEHILEINHCLLSKESQLSKIKKVYSHQQALGQCRTWLGVHLPHAEIEVTSSTAEGVKHALQENGAAAIGSHLAADVFGVPILRKAIQDFSHNSTRFIILSKEDSEFQKGRRFKTSILFSTQDGPGSLVEVLELFRSHKINLTRIESRANREKMWNYIFFVDFEGHRDEAAAKKLISQLKKECPLVKVLGSYPSVL